MKEMLIIVGVFIILLSTILGHETVNIIYANTNLASSYTTILKGFITSYQLTGALVFLLGLKRYKE